MDIGYYVSVYGLGSIPNDTDIANITALNSAEDYHTGALNNFWRSAENFYTNVSGGPPMTWAVS